MYLVFMHASIAYGLCAYDRMAENITIQAWLGYLLRRVW